QQLVGNPTPTRRRRCQPRSRKTLLDYPQLFRRRPSTAATRVNNFKATDVASVSKVIHTDNQLHAGPFGKAAYTGWILSSQVTDNTEMRIFTNQVNPFA